MLKISFVLTVVLVLFFFEVCVGAILCVRFQGLRVSSGDVVVWVSNPMHT